jgi:hypothetical protein
MTGRLGFLSIAFLGALTGCSSAEWAHPIKSKDQFTLDYNKCQADAMRDPKLQQGIQLLTIQATERCVQKMGWRLVEKE